MIIAIDFDDTLVDQRGRAYADVTTPLRFLAGAEYAVHALKRAGHILLLYSARANLALRKDPTLDPLVRAGARRLNRAAWEKAQPVHEARYQQMLDFVAEKLPDVFTAVDDGTQGKPAADLFIDDRALRLGVGPAAMSWLEVAQAWGEPVYDSKLLEERA